MKCLEACKKHNVDCPNRDCRLWIDYKEDLNCTLESVKKNGSMSLREVAKRMEISFVRVKQIEDQARGKFVNTFARNLNFPKDKIKKIIFEESNST